MIESLDLLTFFIFPNILQNKFNFIRGIDYNFVIIEKLAALHSLKGTIKSEDLFEKLCYIVKEIKLNWAKLKSVTSDGAQNMLGSKGGLVAK